MSEETLYAQYEAAMQRLKDHPVRLETALMEMIVIVSALQLALRHPLFPMESKTVVTRVVDGFIGDTLLRLKPCSFLLHNRSLEASYNRCRGNFHLIHRQAGIPTSKHSPLTHKEQPVYYAWERSSQLALARYEQLIFYVVTVSPRQRHISKTYRKYTTPLWPYATKRDDLKIETKRLTSASQEARLAAG